MAAKQLMFDEEARRNIKNGIKITKKYKVLRKLMKC